MKHLGQILGKMLILLLQLINSLPRKSIFVICACKFSDSNKLQGHYKNQYSAATGI
jgi:hypothetical protein